ncbi:MAG: hypothetical protein HW384_746 [Dehalococcoidia bacterium]|nr:hypothetical protein [Dehalococcoidia bacterium]
MDTEKKQDGETKVVRKKLTQKEIEELSKLIGKDYLITAGSWHLPPREEKKKTKKNYFIIINAQAEIPVPPIINTKC